MADTSTLFEHTLHTTRTPSEYITCASLPMPAMLLTCTVIGMHGAGSSFFSVHVHELYYIIECDLVITGGRLFISFHYFIYE